MTPQPSASYARGALQMQGILPTEAALARRSALFVSTRTL